MSQQNERHLKIQILTNDTGLASIYDGASHAYHGDCGVDLSIPETLTIPGKSTVVIDLQIRAAVFDESGSSKAWLVAPRSSISKTPLRLSNSIGIIDAGYRGNVKLAVDNIREEDYILQQHSKIAQALNFNGESFQSILRVDEIDTNTQRGKGGFGSSSTVSTASER